MTYDSVVEVESKLVPGVRFRIARMSFGRRVELMRRVRELARRMEFLEAGTQPGEKMDAGLLQAEIDRLYLAWGLRAVSGLVLDGAHVTPELLTDAGPEELFREALAAVRVETGLTDEERKNFQSRSTFSSPTRPGGTATFAGGPAWSASGDAGG